MLFNSVLFLGFFLVLYLLYWHVHPQKRPMVLYIGSLIFYAAFSVPFLVHFFFVILINYLLYQFWKGEYSYRKISFIIILNIINLAFFKYFYLFMKFISDLTGNSFIQKLSDKKSGVIPEIILPLAISFYTFQILAFQIDVFRKELNQKVSFFDFSFFILFFPQLIAGPIMRHDEFINKIHTEKRISTKSVDYALLLILIGLAKKVILADFIASKIDPVFTDPTTYNGSANLIAIYGFSIQIYCDFSGYTDMARGIALAFGYTIPANFKAPYFSKSFREFWQSWHITLSRWLRDYLYIPLGGNKVGKWYMVRNLFLTMVLGGLWHGANYTFLLWGFLHGIFLSVERVCEKIFSDSKPTSRWINAFRIFIVFHIVTITWVYFRAESIQSAHLLMKSVFNSGGKLIPDANLLFYGVLLFIFFHILEKFGISRMPGFMKRKPLVYSLGLTILIAVANLSSNAQAFIYFQF